MPSSRITERAPLARHVDSGLLEQAAATGLRDDARHAGVPRRGDRRPLDALRSGHLDQILEPEGGRHAAGGRIDLRLVEEHERVQRLHHVAAMQVDQVVARLDQLVEDVVGQRLGEAALAVAWKRAVRVLRVLGRDEWRALHERGGIHEREREHATGEFARVELSHERAHGLDRGVLAAVHPREQAERRSIGDSLDLDDRKLDIREGRIVEPVESPFDHA